jgi:predicted phosphoadenosine phosphosulfate sulfurtransferase
MKNENYLATNVFEEAINRINFVYDNCDDVIVSMSGGKDSTVVFQLSMRIATERRRLPLKVYWLDQEAEWQATGDYMRGVMYRPDVLPFWFQIPFRLTNSLSFKDNYLHCWDPNEREKWIREQDPISIKENPTHFDRFHDVITHLPSYCDCADKTHVAVLVGMRIQESLVRRMGIGFAKSQFKGITWCRKPVANTRVFWPIYDFHDTDIWTAIGSNGWPYNRIYDYMYACGSHMRVSALIHETAWSHIRDLHEFEPQIYDRFLLRVNGVNCFDHFDDEVMPRTLPPYFKDWQEYRDYLLENLIEPEHHERFRNRWKKQHGTVWYKNHVKEVMVNDTDGTLNQNARSRIKKEARKNAGYYRAKDEKAFAEFIKQ